ncbi:MAG: hypothetical protein RJB66_1736 [Pseudomonadota bacterium]
MKISEICSPFLSSHLEKSLGSFDLSEKKATCYDCLCSKPERGALPFYQKNLKCCTFHPFLPNYEVGAILSSDSVSEEFKALIRSKIKNREYALPMGIFVPVAYQVKFNNRAPEDFGNRPEFLCSYYDKNQQQCGIWRHRGSVCTSYFCVSDRGPEGLQFWEMLGEYLHVCEMVLAQDCLVSMGIPPENIDGQLEYINCSTGTAEEMASHSMSEPLFQTYWSDWGGDIEEYYLSCARYLNGLPLSELQNLLHSETSEMEEELRNHIEYYFSN